MIFIWIKADKILDNIIFIRYNQNKLMYNLYIGGLLTYGNDKTQFVS